MQRIPTYEVGQELAQPSQRAPPSRAASLLAAPLRELPATGRLQANRHLFVFLYFFAANQFFTFVDHREEELGDSHPDDSPQ